MTAPIFYHLENGNAKTHRLKLLVEGEVRAIFELDSMAEVTETLERYNGPNQRAAVTYEIEEM